MTSRYIDLSHTIFDGLVTYKGLPPPIVCDFLSREASRSHYEAGTEFHIGKIEIQRCGKFSGEGLCDGKIKNYGRSGSLILIHTLQVFLSFFSSAQKMGNRSGTAETGMRLYFRNEKVSGRYSSGIPF
jgi:hypothetical protein